MTLYLIDYTQDGEKLDCFVEARTPREAVKLWATFAEPYIAGSLSEVRTGDVWVWAVPEKDDKPGCRPWKSADLSWRDDVPALVVDL